MNIMFSLFKTERKDPIFNRYMGRTLGPKHWSPLTCYKIIHAQSSNPEEGKGGTTGGWKGKQRGQQGVTLHQKGYCGLWIAYQNNFTSPTCQGVRQGQEPRTYPVLQKSAVAQAPRTRQKDWTSLSNPHGSINMGLLFYIMIFGLGITRLLQIWYYQDFLFITVRKYDNIYCQWFCDTMFTELSIRLTSGVDIYGCIIFILID